METIQLIFDSLLQPVSVTVAAIAVYYSANAWRREFIGRRNIEFGEHVLSLFYQAQDVIRQMRFPVTLEPPPEGETRQEKAWRHAKERLDRMANHRGLFSELHALRYRSMARFGAHAGAPFSAIDQITHEISMSIITLAQDYWMAAPEENGEEFKQERKNLDQIASYYGKKDDPIEVKIQQAIAEIETMVKPFLDRGN